MASKNEATLPPTRRIRRSLGAAHQLNKAADKENATIAVDSTLAANRKKSRSKSMGPGGLDALKQGSGNRRASLAAPSKVPRSILKPTISPLPEIPPMKAKVNKKGSNLSMSQTSTLGGRSSDEASGSKIALKTEEEQQAAAREREERERRDARRKSLANRRVSFAAEATLHTFHEVDFIQDSTSSADSAKRAPATAGRRSSAAGRDPTPFAEAHSSSASAAGTTDHDQPAATNRNDRDDDTATSILYSSDSDVQDVIEEAVVEDDGNSSSDSDDGTMMSMDDATGTSVVSDRFANSPGESSTLDEALRLAAQRAGNQREDDSDSDDGEEVIPSFGWVRKPPQHIDPSSDDLPAALTPQKTTEGLNDETDMDLSMDITQAVGKIIGSKADPLEDDEDMSMDVTQAVGGILSRQDVASASGDQPTDEDEAEEATMELTTAIGGIHRQSQESEDEADENEDMSMELTTAMGGVLGQFKRQSVAGLKRKSLHEAGVNKDNTPAPASDATDSESTVGMDMTVAVGGIIESLDISGQTPSKQLAVPEINEPSAATLANMSKTPEQTGPTNGSLLRTENTALGHTPVLKPARRTPSSSRTPSPAQAKTPERRASSSRRSSRQAVGRVSLSGSPKPLVEIASSSTKPAAHKPLVFRNDPQTGNRTPTVVLTPQRRRLSGIGADRDGLGSPRVVALFERRDSIGDSASKFVPGKRTVVFQDPKEALAQVELERLQEQDRENPRSILEREADGSGETDTTTNLRDMISNLSPKRPPLNGRKSLAVGSARGLLGKRPAELDSDEDVEDNDGVKRLRGHQGSPVKNIRLQQPPSKAETAGRPMRSSTRALDPTRETPSLASPTKSAAVTTPKHQLRFRDVSEDATTTKDLDFDQSPTKDAAQLEREADEGQIHLQDFLNMTSIRFMELNTTKRRHTVAPGGLGSTEFQDGEDDMSLERCVVAGACTVPNLELYQHSCRELKKYISEGRRIVREIETDTFEENPPLFREYMTATPDVKTLMDNQFKNVKTHARLLSKAMWYEWRMKLQDGLKEGLVRIAGGMTDDERNLAEQEGILASALAPLSARYDAMQTEERDLELAARELTDCDPVELQATRDELVSLEASIEQKKRMVEELRRDLEASEASVQALSSQKQQCQDSIKETEKIREDCRGWTTTEVNALKSHVDKIEQVHGWSVVGISGTWLSMAYKRQIELQFDIAAFQSRQPNSKPSLRYIGQRSLAEPDSHMASTDFFVQTIADHILALPPSRTKISSMLRLVSDAWDKAAYVSKQVQRMNLTFPTTVCKAASGPGVAVKSSILVAPLGSRVEVLLNLQDHGAPDAVQIAVVPEAKVLYGEKFNVTKVTEFLSGRLGKTVGEKEEAWGDVFVELHQKLLARGRKQ